MAFQRRAGKDTRNHACGLGARGGEPPRTDVAVGDGVVRDVVRRVRDDAGGRVDELLEEGEADRRALPSEIGARCK